MKQTLPGKTLTMMRQTESTITNKSLLVSGLSVCFPYVSGGTVLMEDEVVFIVLSVEEKFFADWKLRIV